MSVNKKGEDHTCQRCQANYREENDCANFVCPRCVTDQQFLRCFSNDKNKQAAYSESPSTSNHQRDAFKQPIKTNVFLPSTPNMMHGLESPEPLSNPNLTSRGSGVPTANWMSRLISPHISNNNISMTNRPLMSSSRNSYNTGTLGRGTSFDTSSNNYSASNFATRYRRQQAPSSLLNGMHLSGPDSGRNPTPESQQYGTRWQHMWSATPMPNTMPSLSEMPHNPVANMLYNQQFRTQAGHVRQHGGLTTTLPGGASNSSYAQAQALPTRRTGSTAGPMQLRCRFGGKGSGETEFNFPHGFCLGLEEEIIVADTINNRIQVFDKDGEKKWQFGKQGREEGELYHPRKVAVMPDSGKYVVSDGTAEISRLQLFDKTGHFEMKFDIVDTLKPLIVGLAIAPLESMTVPGHIVFVDTNSRKVCCIEESGKKLSKEFDLGNLKHPSDIAINANHYFICDYKDHCVVVFDENGNCIQRIGQRHLKYPTGIDINRSGNLVVGDGHNMQFHVTVFHRNGSLMKKFEGRYAEVFVVRCCGLKITSEGYVVTVVKDNHQVLVTKTLYIK